MLTKRRVPLPLLLLLAAALPLAAQVDPSLFGGMSWRGIGPFRGGRTVAAVGVPSQPSVFYIGVNNGGVWKTDDYGRVWTPIFDDQPTGSIGAFAVSESNPNILYAGSGEGLQRPDLSTGDGIYKSVDGGKKWTHLGLRDGQQIAQIIVDPKDPNRLFVAVLGHPYGPNEERGIFRSSDGGATFQKILYKNENVGGIDVIFDPANAQTVYAALWEARQGPWENGEFRGPGSGVYKSTDGGATWKQLAGGMPAENLGRVGLEVCKSDPKRLYAVVDARANSGIYRSDDAGATWTNINKDERLWGRGGDFNEVRADPKNADVVYVANVVTWKSVDGGKTFKSFRGAPGGDDYHRVWINPDNTRTILIGSDQGGIVTVNGGETWSSWYNQPTAQMFHVNADNAFPYRVCGGQQESGSACVASRSDDGRITFADWHPVAVEEYGYAVPDPLDPDLVFGGRITRYDRRTGQVQHISPKALRESGYRVVRTQPVVFSPADPRVLFFASNTLWKTTDRGDTWSEISPDLTRKTWSVPPSVGVYAVQVKPAQRGVIYAVAPSPLDVNRIWAGTDDGLIHLTTDGGKTWNDVTPPPLGAWWKVSILEASHFDPQEAYAAVNTLRLDDLRPHIFRTKDGGKTWTETVSGIPAGGVINVMREDPKKRGLLFAGSERETYVSIDDGDHWQSIRLNMPASSIRDLVIKEDDVIVATHGRGFWILDGIARLRQLPLAASGPHLFEPAPSWRFRWSKWTDTPLPPDEPAGQNPPDGAIVDYWLPAAATGPVTIEIINYDGKLLRSYSSETKVEPPKDDGNIPWYWIRPERVPGTGAGGHRFIWDLHWTPLPGKPVYPISAVPFDTAPMPTGPWVLPATYLVRLKVGGTESQQPLEVKMDPRVKTPGTGLLQQFVLSKEVYDEILEIEQRLTEIRALRKRLQAATLTALDKRAEELEGAPGGNEGAPVVPGAGKTESFQSLSTSLHTLLGILQGTDAAPTPVVVAAVAAKKTALADINTALAKLVEEAK
jgi:photosystem II stability/assembly factor-like uncharacterized protein